MSSESSDEENLECLREATDSHFINDSMFKEKPEEQFICEEKTHLKQLPSLRKSKNDDEQFNLFKVTPEFQEFIAKRLSKSLEASLQNCQELEGQGNFTKFLKSHNNSKAGCGKQLKNKACKPDNSDNTEKHLKKPKKKHKEIGIKLFRSSKFFLDNKKNEEQYLMLNQPCQIKPRSKVQYPELSPQALKQISVDPETILRKKETLCWSNRFKAKNLFSYKNNKKGVLELVEPKFV